jgi:hypothetical protein
MISGLIKVGAGTTAAKGHNVELSGPEAVLSPAVVRVDRRVMPHRR